ncbi:hypothetical protein [Erwinia sp.]|uniref:HofO family protein n=1 Tax=Erwinia citreus TaxID=558 RepID=UPI003C766DB1
MNNVWSRWLNLPVWLQGSLLCLTVFASALSLWLLWGSPVGQEAIQLQAQHQLQSRQYQQHLGRLMAAGPVVNAREEIAQLQRALQNEQKRAFSLLRLTSTSGGELADWQPTLQGGSMALDLSWPQVQLVFGYLSTLPAGVALENFTLKPQQTVLRFHLALALNDEE